MNKLLDDYLCNKYPKIFVERKLSPMDSCMGRGFECGNGYFPLINSLCYQIQSHIDGHNEYMKNDHPIKQLIALQVKEKFGELRCYTIGGDDYCRGLIDMAGCMSYTICELCGDGGCRHIGHTSGWIQTICEDCAAETHRKINRDTDILPLLDKAVKEDNNEIVDFYAKR